MHFKCLHSLIEQIGWGKEKGKKMKGQIHEEEWLSHVFHEEILCQNPCFLMFENALNVLRK